MPCVRRRSIVPTVVLATVVALGAVPARGQQAMVKPPDSDPRLSRSNVISCASCHNPAFSRGDGLPKGIGHGMKEMGRRPSTVPNLACIEPLEATIAKLRGVEGYRRLFGIAYPGEGITEKTLANTKARCAACHAGWSFTDGSIATLDALVDEIPPLDGRRGRAA